MKYYAVKQGRSPGIYLSWAECKKQVDGFSGAKYKSFENETEALQYLNKEDETLTESDIEAYVDGSYDDLLKRYAYGCVLLKGDEILSTLSGGNNSEKYIEMRNVAGELEAAMVAIDWAIKNGYSSIKIFHDYEGICSWADGNWKANKPGTREYQRFITEKQKVIHISFQKVKGHSGNKYNELADQLAKKGLAISSIENVYLDYKEFIREKRVLPKSVTYSYDELEFSEKDLISFMKHLIKKKGYKKVSDLTIQMSIKNGQLVCLFNSESLPCRIIVNIYNQGEK